MMKYDVVALGELLVDFTPAGDSAQGNPLYEANPGGAPCNVLSMLAKLGKKTAFIGKVGDDLHGRFLAQSIRNAGIDDHGLVMATDKDTTLAFVALMPDGDRDFSFIRKAGADIALKASEITTDLISDCRIFHFGSLSLTHEPARSATAAAVNIALENNCLISFDPNLRELLWDSMEMAKEQMLWGCDHCSVIKLAIEELFFLTGINELDEAVTSLRSQFSMIRLVLVTDGKNGAHAFCSGIKASCPTFLEVKTIDTTGAGDTFMGYCLSYLLDRGLDKVFDELGVAELNEMLRGANAAASLVTTRKGALCAMPSDIEISQLIT